MPERNLSTGASDTSQDIPTLSLRHYRLVSYWSYKCCPVQNSPLLEEHQNVDPEVLPGPVLLYNVMGHELDLMS